MTILGICYYPSVPIIHLDKLYLICIVLLCIHILRIPYIESAMATMYTVHVRYPSSILYIHDCIGCAWII